MKYSVDDAVYEAGRPIEAARQHVAAGLAKHDYLYVWNVTAGATRHQRNRVSFIVHEGEVLTDADFRARKRKQEMEYRDVEHKLAVEREAERVAAMPPSRRARRESLQFAMKRANALVGASDGILQAMEDLYASVDRRGEENAEAHEELRREYARIRMLLEEVRALADVPEMNVTIEVR